MTEAANRFGWAKRVPGDGRQGCGMGFASMAHKFCNGRRIAEVKGASMIAALATSGVQTLRSNRYGRDRRSSRPRLRCQLGKAGRQLHGTSFGAGPEITTKQLQLILDIGSHGLAHCFAVGFRGHSFVLIRDIRARLQIGCRTH